MSPLRIGKSLFLSKGFLHMNLYTVTGCAHAYLSVFESALYAGGKR